MDGMKAMRVIIFVVAALLAFIPAAWLTIYTVMYALTIFADKDSWLVTVAGAPCLFGMILAIRFCIQAGKQHSVKSLASIPVVIGLILGSAGGMGLGEMMGAGRPPLGFFVWPIVIFVLAGLISAALPSEGVSPA